VLVIFCADPLRRTQPDPVYAVEYAAARESGCDVALMSYEALVERGDAIEAVRQVSTAATQGACLYRGWMLRPEAYMRFYTALAQQGMALINTPEAYRVCHYLPESYPYIAGYTPMTVWLSLADGINIERIMQALQPFGDAPLILKDYVKSRKHAWREACFIPSAADQQAVERVVSRFLQLQGDDLNEGLVFRAFTPLKPLATHPQSGMPLAQEYRRFYLDGAPLITSAYWDVDTDAGTLPPEDLFSDLAQCVPSRFFTIDIARTQADGWLIVELGDGQVAGLPDHLAASAFYHALTAALR
jgi:hypothetical protein